MELIGTKVLEEIIETVLATGVNQVPVSAMLIGASGGGKSRTILRFNSEACHVTNDITARGLFDILKADEKDQRIRHIVLPDFNPVVSHKSSTTNLLLSVLLSCMSEGIVRIDDGRETKACTHAAIGILSALTPQMYDSISRRLSVTGLMRRLIPIHFSYSEKTRTQAQEAIAAGEVRLEPLTEKKPRKTRLKLAPKISEAMAKRIQALSDRYAVILTEQQIQPDRRFKLNVKIEPFSPHLVLRQLAEANAGIMGINQINESSLEFLCQIVGSADPREGIRL